MLLAVIAAATLANAPADYRNQANWICRPGRDDACVPDSMRAIVSEDGSITKEVIRAASAPGADCFYVYPTASQEATPNSDMTAGTAEKGQAASQFAVFARVCRTFAPIYRQVTLSALRSAMARASASGDKNALGQIKGDWNLAYGDVKAAWQNYLQNENHGRPFVLIGHSQGSLMLKRLIAEEIDGKPVAARMLSAILPGVAILVPKGKTVGGDFKTVPLCRANSQTVCVITWASYRDSPPPPDNAIFGRSDNPTLEAGCTNPARLQGGVAPLDAIVGYPWWIKGVVQYQEPSSGWSVQGKPIEARFARIPGMLSGECVSANGLSYLSVHVNPAAGDGLSATITAPGLVGDTAYPEWGWHVMDIPIVQGDLVRLIGRQLDAWNKRHTDSH